MKRYIAYFCIVMALAVFNGYVSLAATDIHYHADVEDEPVQELDIMPFNDGVFILVPSDFDESHFDGFRFGNVQEIDLVYYKYYRDADFLSHSTEFINVMNGLSPVLVDSIVAPVWGIPFEALEHNESLYSFQLFEFPSEEMYIHGRGGFNKLAIHMLVFETDEYGLLYFCMAGFKNILYPSHMRRYFSEYLHSLYRITLSDLYEIVRFAESLERKEIIGRRVMYVCMCQPNHWRWLVQVFAFVATMVGTCFLMKRWIARKKRETFKINKCGLSYTLLSRMATYYEVAVFVLD